MPFLAIFRKDKDKDSSRSKTPVPQSPTPASISSRKSLSFSRARPSFTSSRSCTSPPPQIANISPHSDFDYVLPDIEGSPAPEPEKELAQVPEEAPPPVSPVKLKRALPFGRRRGSASSGVIVAAVASGAMVATPRPFSEALDSFMTRKQQQTPDLDRPRDGEAHAPTPLASNSNPESITRQNVNSPATRHTTTLEDLDSADDDDDPLVPPPPRASVFGGYAYSDKDVPVRSQSLPDIDRENSDSEMVRSESGHSRPPRPQVHPHQLARGKNKSVDLNSLLASPSNLLGSSSAASDTAAAPIKTKQKDASTKSSGGLFSWRSNKSSKEVPTVAPIVTADPADSSFSLKSFRHVGPASIPSSPVGQTGSVMGSSTNVNTAGISANTTNTTTTAIVSSPPSSYGRASPALGTRPVPGRTGVTRERVNSTGSEGVMTAGLFRQAARRSNTNLVEEAGPASPRSSVTGIRDREKRGPPTRSWDVRDKDGDQSSGSERVSAPVRGGGATSDRSALGVGGKPRTLGRSSSAMPSVGGESSPESPSPFAAALSKLGEEDPLTRSGYEGGGARLDYARYGVRSEGAVRSVSAAAVPVSRPTQPRPSIHGINVRPEMRGVNARPMPQSASASPQSAISRPSPPGPQSSIPRPGPQGINSSRPGPQSATSQRPGPQSANSVPAPQRPGPQSAHSRPSLPNARSSSPTKPRQSAPTAMGRSPPIRTTIPTKTNDGPSIKPRATSPVRMMSSRPPSPARSTRSNRSVPGSPTRSIASSPTKSIMSKSTMASSPTKSAPGLPIKSSMRRPSVDTTGPSGGHSRYASVDTYRAKSPSADMYRAKSPSVDMTRAKSPAPSHMSRAKSPAPSNLSRSGAKSPGPGSGPAPRTGYVPPPRQSSLARPMDLVDSDEDESEDPEVESEEELGYGSRPGEKKVTESDVGVLRGRGSGSSSSPFASRQGSSTGHDGLTRERTITQRTAGSGRGSPSRDDDRPPKPPPKVGVSLFDRPVPPSSVSSLSSSPFDKFGTPPSSGTPPSRGRASHSTSAISAAATARNSAAIAEANRRLGVHSRGASSTSTTPGRSSHIRSPAEATDTDEDEDDKSETDSEDNAPLSSIVPPRRPGSAASNAPPMVRSFGRAQKPLVDLSSGPNGPPPPRPPRRVPGVGVTRNSSLRGSRSVEDLGRMTMAPGSAIVGATGRPGPRPFATSPPSSTGDSNSSKAPVTPRDGSEAGGRRVVGASSLGPAGDEARRKERRRSEAKASVELGNVINGPGVMDDDDEDGEHMSAQMHGGMGMMGWGQQGLYPQMTGYQGFPVSQSMPSFPGQFPTSQSMPFIPPPPPPGASEQYVAAHQQAMMMAKQAYLSAVAQQAMMFATEQWERSSNAGGSVYGGSQMGGGGGGMMGMPMMGMYANSAYASSMYEGSVIGGGGGGGWGSASAYGGGARSVYGGGGAGAKSEYGGGMKSSPTKSNAGGPGRSRLRAQTATAEVPPLANRGNPVPPSTWTTRRKASPPGRYQ